MGVPVGLPRVRSAELAGHQGPVLVARFTPSGSYCLTGGRDRSVKLWNPFKGGLLIKSYEAHAHEVRDVCASSDNARLASCGGDRQPLVWDVPAGRVLRRFRGHDSAVNCAAFLAGGQVLATGGYDRAVKLWDLRGGSAEAVQAERFAGDSVSCLAAPTQAGAAELLFGSVDGTVRTLDVRRGEVRADALGAPVTSLALTADEQCVLCATLPGRLALLDRGDGSLLAEYRGHSNVGAQVACAVPPSDAAVAAGSEDGKVHCWDIVEEAQLPPLQAHGERAAVVGVAFHREKGAMLTCATDGTASLWEH
mmetsp:Transcript_26618/g.90971  ORF Transcript_26618/g.90971 Transcript_26618/m.90971 type:complete len:308 (-) Transcript_26618:79-1002(-)